MTSAKQPPMATSRRPGVPARLARPSLRAKGSCNMTGGIAAREAAPTVTRAASTRPGSARAVSAARRAISPRGDGDDTVCAHLVIAHDGELGRGCRSAAESVGAVGQAILVERAGGGDQRRQGEDGGERRRQSDSRGKPIDQTRRQAQSGADQGKYPHRLGQRPGGPVAPGQHRQTCQKPGGKA